MHKFIFAVTALTALGFSVPMQAQTRTSTVPSPAPGGSRLIVTENFLVVRSQTPSIPLRQPAPVALPQLPLAPTTPLRLGAPLLLPDAPTNVNGVVPPQQLPETPQELPSRDTPQPTPIPAEPAPTLAPPLAPVIAPPMCQHLSGRPATIFVRPRR